METLSTKAINQYLDEADSCLAKADETTDSAMKQRYLRRAAEAYRRCGWESYAAKAEIEAKRALG